MPRYSQVLFDLDGTLIDSAPAILASYRDAFASTGHRPVIAIDARDRESVKEAILVLLNHALDRATGALSYA